MKEVLVLGIGNRLMMDDGIGVYVVEELKKTIRLPGVRYLAGETDFNYCLDQLEGGQEVIIVDAAYLGNKPGSIGVISLGQILINAMPSAFAHEIHFFNEIKNRDVNGIFIGIEPYTVGYCLTLSKFLQMEFYRIVDNVKKIVESYIHG